MILKFIATDITYNMLSTASNAPLTIPKDVQQMIRTFLRNKLLGNTAGGYCFFRYFSHFFSTEGLKITKHIDPNTAMDWGRNLSDITPADINRYMEINYRFFNGITHQNWIRPESEVTQFKKVFINSKNYSQVDFTLDYTFEFSNDKRLCSPVTPVQGDLLFIFISKKTLETNTDKTHLQADKWCIVSDQFLRMYSAIMYDWHDTFQHMMTKQVQNSTIEEKEVVLKKKLFTGNRLMTNSWLKYKCTLEDNGRQMSQEESRNRYWHLRTEYSARKWVDVYVAIVLVARYGELPCPANIPDYIDGPDKSKITYHRKRWILPPCFVTKFLESTLKGTISERETYCEKLLNRNNISNIDEWEKYCKCNDRLFSEGEHTGILDQIASMRSDNIVPQNNNVVTKTQSIESSFGKENNLDISKKDHPTPLLTWAKVVTKHLLVPTTTTLGSESGTSRDENIETPSTSIVSIITSHGKNTDSVDSQDSTTASTLGNADVQINVSSTSAPNVENITTIQLQFDLPKKWSDVLMDNEVDNDGEK